MPEFTKERFSLPPLSGSQENYLVAIWQLDHDHSNVRVKDIAEYRHVKPGSVSPAMAKLAELDLINYSRRDSISLTQSGRTMAEKLVRRRQLLMDFFEDFLNIPAEMAREESARVAHSLTEQSTRRLEGLMHQLRHAGVDPSVDRHSQISPSSKPPEITIAEMLPGQKGVVRHIRARGELHHQLIDMGLLPDSSIQLISGTMEAASTFVVALQGFEIALTLEQADAVVVSL